MKEDEDIETMFSRFQVLVSRLQVPNKSYTTSDHVKKILRSIPAKYKSKVTAIKKAKDLNKIILESLIRNLQSHGMKHIRYEPAKKPKSHALKFVS